MISDFVRETYEKKLREHIAYVVEAGRRIGVSEKQLAIHDRSKWSTEEFEAYAKYFCSGANESPLDSSNVSDEFALAWLHHIHHNPHHWQHWIFPDRYTPKGSLIENGVIEMPKHYAREMVADWMGASKAYTGSWDMTDWFCKNAGRIRLHSKTASYIVEILTGSDMSDVIHPDVVHVGAFAKNT